MIDLFLYLSKTQTYIHISYHISYHPFISCDQHHVRHMLFYSSQPIQPIQVGDRVQIEGLTNNLQYNNKEGVVIKIGNGSEARITLQISPDTRVRARSINLIFKHRQEIDATKDTTGTTQDKELQDDVSTILNCSTCDKPQTSDFILKICQCRTRHYCNTQCQKKDYKQHKKECLHLVKEQKKKSLKEDGTKDGKKRKTIGAEEGEEDFKKLKKSETNDAKKEMPKQEREDEEDCPICTDALPKLSHQFVRLSCCGKGLHTKCSKDLLENKSMTYEQKLMCIMCRTKNVATGSKKDIKRLHNWVKKGKAWAMAGLAQRYDDGLGVKQSDKKAIELYEKAAKRGIAGAQYMLGQYYQKGIRGLTQSDQRAFEYYKQAAEQGVVNAQVNVGSCYYYGTGIEQSNAKARKWWTKAASQGKAALMMLGSQGQEIAINCLKQLNEAERLKSTTTTPPELVDPNTITCSTCGKPQNNGFKLKKCACYTTWYCDTACQKKHRKQHKKECLRLVKERKKKKNGQNIKENGTKNGKKKKPKPLQEEEDKEDCPICTDALPKLSSEFARLTCCGKGLHIKCYEDLVATKCMTWEQKDTCIMCRSKMPAAGSKEQIERIRGWVKKGKAWAMAVLGDRYTDGVGVKQSDKKAVELYEMAAKRGNAGAQFSLGEFYEHGSHGLTQSSQRAIELYTLSAEQGAAEAQFKIGSCYFQGNIVEQSFVKAREWMTKAAAQGHYGAIQCLKMMDAMGM